MRNSLFQKFGPQLVEAAIRALKAELDALSDAVGVPRMSLDQLMEQIENEHAQLTEYDWQIPEPEPVIVPPDPMHKKILVTGAPRSGTHAYVQYLREQGLDIGHEEIGHDGAVSCWMWQNRHGYTFDKVQLLVRDPRRTIVSMLDLVQLPPFLDKMGVQDLLSVHDTFQRSVRLWTRIYEQCVHDELIRIEDIPECELFRVDKPMAEVSYIKERDPEFGPVVERLARKFGYI